MLKVPKIAIVDALGDLIFVQYQCSINLNSQRFALKNCLSYC